MTRPPCCAVLGQRQGKFEADQLIGRGVAIGGAGGGIDKGEPGCRRVVGGKPMASRRGRRSSQSDGQRGMMPRPRDRQQVPRHGPSDRGVAKGDGVPDFHDEAVLERFIATRPQVGVEHAVAFAWSRHRPWRGPFRTGIERRRHGGQPVAR